GYDDVQSFEDAGGINTLFQADTQTDPGSFVGRDILKHLVIKADHQEGHIPQAVRAKMADGTTAAVDLRLQSGEWQGSDALLMALTAKTDTTYTGASDGERMSDLLGQSTDVMDIASDGILIIDETGKLIHANSSAEALFDRDRSKMRGLKITTLFAEESQKSIQDYLDGLTSNGVASVLNDGRELIAQESNGGLIPLFITIGRLEKNERFADGVFCVVLRDITQWKRAEEELLESRRIAENANAQKSDFLAAISHEIRTPLNAIIGFSEVMMEQHYGPMENPRYLEYARDINASGNHLMSLVNDLLDLSKIEAGKLDLTFSSVILNTVIQECVALMQPDANKDRIIIRTSLMESLPPVVADMRSIRQIALNLLSNAVKFTKAGGQVIISTTLDENGEVAIRVRDTGIGMSEDDLQYALQPFRQVEVDQKNRKPGTGLGLPLTKALVEANRARFIIDSRVNYGTLIQVVFPNERVLAR
ncbi:MAG: PAS domain-containing sensor histidine kinase, partial [Hyphomicrobiales bacterium]